MIFVNGKPLDAGREPTVRDVLLALEIDPDRAGIAVAVDAEVTRRGDWRSRTVAEGAHVEIVQAVQGG